MKYSAKIEAKILKQIALEPEREIILPDWAYGARLPQPQVHIDGMREPLIRRLYCVLISDLPDRVGVINPPHVNPRNVNPHLAVLVPSRRSKFTCERGHQLTLEDYEPNVGYHCHTCAEMEARGPGPARINAEKTHCPAGHEYTRQNTQRRKDGRRRCKICAREQSARWRAKQREQQ